MTSPPVPGIDHDTFVGSYPFRRLPEPTPAALLADLDRHGVAEAWVGHLPSVYYRDAAAGNDELLAALDGSARLHPVPVINPAWPGWSREVARAVDVGAPAVRTWPHHYGYAAGSAAAAALAAACAEAGLPIILAMRLEDPRQRSRLDVAADLIGADVRAFVRAHPAVRLLVTGADRALIEEVHFGSTPDEAARIRYDACAVWGPPEEHLAHLFRTIGRDRFVYGSQWPLRAMSSAIIRLETAQSESS